MSLRRVFFGTFVHSLGLDELELKTETYLGVEYRTDESGTRRGIIAFVVDERKEIPADWLPLREVDVSAVQRSSSGDSAAEASSSSGETELVLLKHRFMMPGLVDTHTHAPQYKFTGTGRMPLLEWLNTFTFPVEARFSDEEYARHVYERCVARHVGVGTTTCCYYATIHLEASVLLGEIVRERGQRAFIGKVCMDSNSPEYYVETTEDSIAHTREFVERITALQCERVQPIITPRFAPSCSSKLLAALGDIAGEHDLCVQTHLSENVDEIKWVAELFPEASSYTDVYERAKLLTPKTVLAHAIYLSEEEIALIRERESGVSHCPNSNVSIRSGVLDARELLAKGVKVGLGTDVAGGYSPSMLNAIRHAMVASSVMTTGKHADNPDYMHLDSVETFYLATMGGAELVGLSDRIGNFAVGKEFDALLIDPTVDDSPLDIFDDDEPMHVFEKFLFNGDDRNIVRVFVSGECIHSRG